MAKVETLACGACGRIENIDLIDAKDDGTGDYVVFECIACYGEGWAPAVTGALRLSVCPDLKPHYERYREASR
jgi:hypothetical protein